MTRRLQIFITPFSVLVVSIWVCLLAPAHTAEKWSRQLEPTSPGVSDSFDWVPVAQPVDSSTAKDRSANARVLTYSQAFPPNGRFGDLHKPHNPPVSQQQPFDFPYQFQRFVNPPPRPQVGSPFGAPPLKPAAPAVSLQSGEPTSQSFFKFEMPFRTDGGNRGASGPPNSLQTGYQIQHTFGGGAQATLFSSPVYNDQPVFPPEFHPIPQKPLQQSLQKPLPQQNFIEDSFLTKNVYRESKPNPTQQSLQSVTPQVFPVEPPVDQFFDLNRPSSFNSQLPFQQADTVPTAPFQQSATAPTAPASAPSSNGGNQQDVQLLYVPYDTLYNQQKPESQAFEVNKYNINAGLPTVNPFQINQFYTQDSLGPLDQQNYFTSSTTTTSTSRPKTTTLKPTTIFQNYANPQLTTPRPKPKAHQPPLAMFLVRNSARPTQSDVVSALRHSNTIAVVDAPTKKIPEIFVGPAGMSTPDGYVKFDLPYLSQLTQTRELRDIPFFVAPLSYRTTSGFNKILLPEPHVGSIVINLAKSNSITQEVISQPAKPSVVYSQNDINQYQAPPQPTQRVRPHRVKQPSTTKDYYPAGTLTEPVHKNRDQFEVTTQRATLAPTRGNKFNYFYNQDAIQEVSSPKVTKHDRPKKKRPQHVQQQPIEQPTFTQTINNPYAQFQPAPNQIFSDDIYKVQPNRPAPSTSTSTSTTTTTTSTTSTTAAPAHAFFTFNPNGQIEFPSAHGPLYSFGTIPKEPVEEQVPRFTTRPPTTPEEEYRMKQYFRQQDAFRNRPQIVNPTNPPFEQVQYTPVDLDYERNQNVPSTTHKTTSTTKQRVTFYSPSQPAASAPEDTYNVVQQPDFAELQRDKEIQAELKPHRKQPANHRPLYNQNEIPDSTVEYEPNPYHVPSELPPLTPNLPGLVNNLEENDKQNSVAELASTTPAQPEKELPTRPTRRPINRVRKPVVSKVTSSVSYSETETSTRRPIQRVRRPFGARATASTTATPDGEEEPTSTTRRPSSAARNPLIRNPNRIRYQPTPEERQTLRTKQRKKYGDSGKDEDLDYQRDVLKQNYPIIKPLSSRTPSSPTAIPSSYTTSTGAEAPTSETQQIYTVTPSNTVETNEQTFPAGMLEPMQIAQQYSQYTKDNFGPGYFPNQEDLGPTEPIIRNEINPVFTTLPSTTTSTTTTTTTTTEEPQVTTRRSPFIRRNYPRLRTTTTEAPTTAPAETETKTSLRPRIPPRKVIKVRTRTRRPQYSVSSTQSPEEESEVEEPKNNFRKINRFNHDLYENDATPPQRRRQRPSFQLDGQESQWSPALKLGSNHHFKPSNPKERAKESEHKFEEEPEIVTIGPENDKKADNFEVNVSASFGEVKPTIRAPNLKPEKSFAELLEEVMGKAPEEKPLESVEETSTRSTDDTFFESQKTTIFNRINRRNKFKKLRLPSTPNSESFETAESQNLGSQLYNSLYGKEKSTIEIVNELKTTTPLTPASIGKITGTTLTTTASPLSTMYTDEPTTSEQLEVTSYATTVAMDEAVEKTTNAPVENEAESVTAESATRRMDDAVDDLESQPSIFSEVKRQLHDLFAIDESEDHAVTAALAAVGKRRQEYMNIKRTKPDTTTQAMNAAADVSTTTESTVSATTEETAAKKLLQKSLMDQVVYATSTSTKVTSETEICYRGRCIRSEDLPANHKLH